MSSLSNGGSGCVFVTWSPKDSHLNSIADSLALLAVITGPRILFGSSDHSNVLRRML
jgi:hypothetical protein